MKEPTVKNIQRISVAANGTQANGDSYNPALSADGRTVAFSSYASNLVPGDTNDMSDIFVKDLTRGAITRAAGAASNDQTYDFHYGPTLSADGKTVAYHRSVPGETEFIAATFIKNLRTGAVTRAADGAQENEGSHDPALSADGQTVAFNSGASTLVPGDTNGASDIFVMDLTTRAVTRASVAADATQANEGSYTLSLSADGRTVAFDSYASNLVLGDTNEMRDIFIKDLTTGAVTLASVGADGTQGNGLSYRPTLSADGRTVAFSSYASNLVPGDTNGTSDIFVMDLRTGGITRTNVAADGTQANGGFSDFALSADGRTVAFSSHASNLVPGDTNGASDIFVKDLTTGVVILASVGADGTQGNGVSYRPALSADGRTVAFYSHASNLVPSDTNGASDVFVVTLAWPDVSSINGSPGRDVLNGTAGNDTINGLGGDDILNGGAGDDVFNGGPGNDTLNGDAGADRLNGQEGADVLNGGSGDDVLMGGAGDDVLNGDAGKDELSGAGGDDVLNGGEEDDRLNGGDGADVLNGGSGGDLLDGGIGDDLLDGGAGRDALYGGSGADVFVCRPVSQATPANGAVEWIQWKIEDGGNGHWYALIETPRGLSWQDAKAAAEQLAPGTHLATFTRAAEGASVAEKVLSENLGRPYSQPWLGEFQPDGSVEPDSGWQWVTGKPFVYPGWAEGEPNDEGGEDALHVWGLAGWNDRPANVPLPTYLVEADRGPAEGVDRIMDFEDGVDRLDLTAFAFNSLDDLAALIQPKGPDTLIDLSTVGGEDTLIAGINVFEFSPDDLLI